MDSLLIEARYIDSVVADMNIEFFGDTFSMPVMTPAFSHLGNYAGRDNNGLEEYLPEIRTALAGRDVKIIVDCGIASGADVFKALALGADAAAVGRSMLPSLEKGGVKYLISMIRLFII